MTRWRARAPRMARIAAELALGFGVLVLFDRLVLGGGGAFRTVQPNPLWLPVLATALAYGTFPALAAAGIASALWLVFAGAGGAERDYLDHLFHLSLPPLLWFVAAVVIGEVTMLRVQRHRRLEKREGVARRNVARLTEAFHQLARTNRVLQVQVATDARSTGHIVALASRLSADDPAQRREALTRLIAAVTQGEDFTCYRVTGNEARAWLRGATATGRAEVLPDALARLAVRRHGPIHVGRAADRAALSDIGVVAIPLRIGEGDGARFVGCLVLHDLPATAMTTHALAELTEVAGWLAPLLVERGGAAVRSAGRAA